MDEKPRGRYAPTPSGWIHVGNARTALVAWLSIRSRGGTFLWRLEDLDPPRALKGAADAAIHDLRWLGLDWDEGPDVGGPFAPYTQSERYEFYEEALRRLADQERLFPCGRTRRELKELTMAPHGTYGPRTAPYPKAWRPQILTSEWYERYLLGADSLSNTETVDALRFRVDDQAIAFNDLAQGTVSERVHETVGDFVLKRRDGLYAYQLAVVVDDLLMGVNEVVRGMDLLDSTARQIQLTEALGGPVPRYGHLPMVLNADGDKLSKRDGGLTLRSLRDDGTSPEALVGFLAHTLGLLDRPMPCKPSELVPVFDWSRIQLEDHRLSPEWPESR